MREGPDREALIKVMEEIEDPEVVKGFFITHGSVFMVEGDTVQLFGLVMELVYDIGGKEVIRCMRRVLNQQRDQADMVDSPATEYAKQCSIRYNALFQ